MRTLLRPAVIIMKANATSSVEARTNKKFGGSRRNLVSELLDPVGVEPLYDDMDTMKFLKARADQLQRVRASLEQLGYYEWSRGLLKIEREMRKAAV